MHPVEELFALDAQISHLIDADSPELEELLERRNKLAEQIDETSQLGPAS